MTFIDMTDAGIDFQSEIRFSVYDYEKDELVTLNPDEAKYREIKYMYPLGIDAMMIEIEPEDSE